MRRVLVAVAWPLALVSGTLVVVGMLTVLLLAVGMEPGGPDCRCGDTDDTRATSVVQARVASRHGDDLLLDVDRVEEGAVRDPVVVRSFGVQLRPWRRYRLWLFAARGRLNVSSDVGPETLGLAFPTGLRAFAALPGTARLGAVALPLFAASASVLVAEQGRARSRYGRPIRSPA